MELVVDATVLFAAIIGKGKTNDLFFEEFEILKRRVEIFPIYKFPDEVQSKAEKLAPHRKDAPYFALALHLGCAVWSREKAFKKQAEIRVYSTSELVDIFLTK